MTAQQEAETEEPTPAPPESDESLMFGEFRNTPEGISAIQMAVDAFRSHPKKGVGDVAMDVVSTAGLWCKKNRPRYYSTMDFFDDEALQDIACEAIRSGTPRPEVVAAGELFNRFYEENEQDASNVIRSANVVDGDATAELMKMAAKWFSGDESLYDAHDSWNAVKVEFESRLRAFLAMY